MSQRDYYEILGVSRTATAAELKQAYRRLAMKYHPDRNQDDPEAQERFKEVKQAYEVLKDEQKRAAYDRFGHAGVDAAAAGGAGFGHGAAGFGDLNDLFGDIFNDIFGGGGRRRGSQARSRRGQDLKMTVELDLEEAVTGVTRELRVPSIGKCSHCGGTGSTSGKMQVCSTCGGAGEVRMQQGFFSVRQTCPNCGGAGREIRDPCQACHGSGQVRETRTLQIKIPPGVDDGDRIRLSGEGGAGRQGGNAGDLYVDIRVRPHRIFQRDGDHLYAEVPIPVTTAILGGEIEVPTLAGSVKVKIPEGTQTGKTFRLKGKGVRSVRSSKPGDLMIRVVVETPVNLTRRQKELLRELDQELRGDSSRDHSPASRSWTDSVKDFFDRMGL